MNRLLRRTTLSALVASSLLVTGTASAGAAGDGSSGPKPLRFATTVLPHAGGEPNVSISPNGKTVLVDGLSGSPADLWRSTDGGRTFTHISPNFSSSGGGDFDMRWLDGHTVVAADLSIGDGIYVHRSTDGGLTWTTANINEDVYDRPWLGVAGNHVYVIAKGFDGIPYCYFSNDGGVTFSPVPVPLYGTGTSPNPGESFGMNQNTYVDHAAVDPVTGDLYVIFGLAGPDAYSQQNPLGVPNHLYIAHLVDGVAGPEFVDTPIYLGGAGDGFIDGFNWLTIDRSGTLYALANGAHAGHESLWLSYSKDKGQTWSSLVDLGEAGATNVYGSIAAGSVGTLALVYLRGTTTDPSQAQPWYVEMARVTGANTASPKVQRVRPIAAAIHTQDICFSGILCGLPGFGSNRDLLDYIWDAVAPNGHAFAVIASDGPATGGSGVSVVVLRQTSGPGFGRGVPS